MLIQSHRTLVQMSRPTVANRCEIRVLSRRIRAAKNCTPSPSTGDVTSLFCDSKALDVDGVTTGRCETSVDVSFIEAEAQCCRSESTFRDFSLRAFIFVGSSGSRRRYSACVNLRLAVRHSSVRAQNLWNLAFESQGHNRLRTR